MLRTQITLGVLLMLVSIGVVTYTLITEEERMATETSVQEARSIETGAELFHRNCINCHGERAEGIPGLCPPLNSLTLLQARVDETGWSGSVHSYIVDTIRGGRIVSTRPDQYIGESASGMAMPFWGQDYGGPLRDDQIRDIANYLINFGETDLVVDPGQPEVSIPDDASDEDIIVAGLQIYAAQGCGGCHQLEAAGSAGAVGPTHNGLAATAQERLDDPNYSGAATTPYEYIAESIVNPGVYVVDGYGNIMPPYPNLSESELNALVQMLLAQP